MHQFRHLLAFLALIAACAGAAAFEVNGMKAGMPGEQALQLLRGRSDRVSPVGDGSELEQSYLGTNGATNTTEAITICRGRLFAYQHDIVGGFRAFVRAAQSEQSIAGSGTAVAIARDTRVGEWSLVRFTWQYPGWIKEISYSFIASEQTYIRYAVGAQGCR
jgi:hypothetical protein